MRKAQAALEFLTTYGWAFIVILVMIGALAYFGVLNPSKVTPSRCIVEAGLSCNDFRISANAVNITLTNGKGEGLTINGVTVQSDVATITGCAYTASVPDGTMLVMNCVINPALTSIGDKIKFNFNVSYKMAKGIYNQTFGGSIYGQVQ
jgi:hypothetical protein